MVVNSLVAPGTDPNVALATAAAIYGPPPASLDPVQAGTATTMVVNGLVAPGTDPNAALATAAAIYGPPPASLDPVRAGTATAMVLNGLVAPGTDPQRRAGHRRGDLLAPPPPATWTPLQAGPPRRWL